MTTSTRNDWNTQVIEEFRANQGQVRQFGRALLLLTTTGARSGHPVTAPVMYRRDGDRLLVFASKGGAPTNPAWYHNLVAHPDVTVETGTEKFPARATVLQGAERDAAFAAHAAEYPQFAEYQEKTSRTIPVIALERADAA